MRGRGGWGESGSKRPDISKNESLVNLSKKQKKKTSKHRWNVVGVMAAHTGVLVALHTLLVFGASALSLRGLWLGMRPCQRGTL